MMHYHMLSGMHGYMPDNNELYATEEEARLALQDFAERVFDDETYPEDEIPHHWSPDTDYFEFYTGHGVEYAEVVDCTESDCEDELASLE